MTREQKLPAVFSETEAQRILARAAELEGTIGTRFTVEDLRSIAARAGIEAHALEQAISETAAEQDGDRPSPTPNGMVPIDSGRIAMLAGAGVALGALAIMADHTNLPGSSAIPVFAPSALFTLYLALKHPVREGLGGLLRQLGLVFGSFTAAVIAMQGLNDASAAVTWSFLCGAAASGIHWLRTGGSGSTDSVPSVAPADTR